MNRRMLTVAALLLFTWPTAQVRAGDGDKKGAPETTKAEAGTKAPGLDGQALRELGLEHSRSRDALLAAEARLGLVEEKIYDARLEVSYKGDLDSAFALARVELWLDGGVAYSKDFARAPSVQMLKLFDGYLPEGAHRVEIRILARGAKDDDKGPPGYVASSGLRIQLKKKSVGRLVFEAEQDGEAARSSDPEPEADWDVEIEARYRSETKE